MNSNLSKNSYFIVKYCIYLMRIQKSDEFPKKCINFISHDISNLCVSFYSEILGIHCTYSNVFDDVKHAVNA